MLFVLTGSAVMVKLICLVRLALLLLPVVLLLLNIVVVAVVLVVALMRVVVTDAADAALEVAASALSPTLGNVGGKQEPGEYGVSTPS